MIKLIYISILGILISCGSSEKSNSGQRKKEVPSENHPVVKSDLSQFELKGKVKSLHVTFYLVALENGIYVPGEMVSEQESYYFFDSKGYIEDHYMLNGIDTVSHTQYKHDNYGNLIETKMKSWADHSINKYEWTYMKEKNLNTELKHYRNDSLEEITTTHWEVINGGWLRKESKKNLKTNSTSVWEFIIIEDGNGNVIEKKDQFSGQILKHVRSKYDSDNRLIKTSILAGPATVEYFYKFDSLGFNTEIMITNSGGANKQITKITHEYDSDTLNWIQCFRNTDNKSGYFEKREIEYY